MRPNLYKKHASHQLRLVQKYISEFQYGTHLLAICDLPVPNS